MDQFGRRQQSKHWPSSFECEFAFITNIYTPRGYCTGSRLCVVKSKMAGRDKNQFHEYCTGSRLCVVKSKMVCCDKRLASWILHRVEVLRGEIQDGALWQKTSLVNIAPGRGSAWSNPRWPAVTKNQFHEYCTRSKLCAVKSKMTGRDKNIASGQGFAWSNPARCDNREYCIGSKRCLMKSKMAGRDKSEYLLFCPNF